MKTPILLTTLATTLTLWATGQTALAQQAAYVEVAQVIQSPKRIVITTQTGPSKTWVSKKTKKSH